MTLDDMDAKVLDFMFLLLQVKNAMDDDAEEDEKVEDDNIKAEQSKEHYDDGDGSAPNQASAIQHMAWFFHGWIILKLLGPMAPQE
jgi:hypothetical protein